jgi:hypothetical protein
MFPPLSNSVLCRGEKMETIAQSSTFRWFSKTSRAVRVKLSFGHKASKVSN